MEEILRAILTSQANLQTAVVELCRATGRSAEQKPRDVLTKLTPDDDVETYITLFERAATREKWPKTEWANNLMPFLTGEAQKACRDLSAADALSYDKVKTAILAQYGLSLPAKAQRVYDWSYDPALPVRAQVMGLDRHTRSWLEEGEGPPIVDRVVIDRCTRGLPNDIKRYVAQQGPPNMDTLIALLESHQVMASLMRSENTKPNNFKVKAEREMVGKAISSPPARTPSGWTGPASRRTQWPPPIPRCFSCGREGHLARECPDRDEPMPTAGSTDNKGLYCHHLTTCWAHEGAPAPRFPVKIAGRDTEALLDSGSMVSLVRPQFASAPWGEEMAVSCIHGDTRKYPTSEIQVITPRGRFTLQVGVVEQLPVPVLFGRDSPLFSRYWPAEAMDPKRRTRKRPVKMGKSSVARPAWAAVSPDGSPAETTNDVGRGRRQRDPRCCCRQRDPRCCWRQRDPRCCWRQRDPGRCRQRDPGRCRQRDPGRCRRQRDPGQGRRLHGNADAMSRRDDCLWSAAPHRGSELSGGVCGGPAGEQCPTWLSTAKQGEARGMVVDGRYYPRGSHRELLPSQVSLIVPHRWRESTRQSGAFLTSTRGYGEGENGREQRRSGKQTLASPSQG